MPPKRPREHELERESRNRFEAAILTQKWLVRDMDGSGDYGIDQEVEIFADGATTGLTFRVQTKGADNPDRTGAYRDVALNHFEYWSSLDSPVLLVLWVASEDRVYAKWVHAYDFGRKPPGKKTHRVRFGEEDLLTNRIPNLMDEVRIFRSLGTGWLPRPIPLRVEFEPAELKTSFVFALRTYVHHAGLLPFVRIVEDPSTAIVARVSEEGLRVELPANAGSMNIHVPSGYSNSDTWQMVIGDILVGTGVLAGKLGATADATRLIRAGNAACLMTDIIDSAEVIVAVAVRERDASFVLDKVEQLLGTDILLDDQVFQCYFAALAQLIKELSNKQFKRFRKLASARIKLEIGEGSAKDAARLAHNMAVLCKKRSRWDLVDHFIDQALELDPAGYGGRPDVALFRGNSRYHAGDYSGAAAFYEEAWRLGFAAEEIVPPLSDIWMELGRYKQSADLIDDWVNTDREAVDSRTVLRRVILDELVSGLELHSQARAPLDDAEVDAIAEFEDEQVVEALKDSDALDRRLWAKFGGSENVCISPLGEYALGAFRSNHAPTWLLVILAARLQEADPWVQEHLLRGAIASPGFAEVAADATDLDLPDLKDFIEQVKERALSFDMNPGTTRLVNLVDSENQVMHTLKVTEDGEVVGVEDFTGAVRD